MMKYLSFIIPVLLTSSLATAAEQTLPTLSDFAGGENTKALWHKLTNKASLPGWVKNGGTTGASYNVTLEGEKYIVMSGCKPHDCATEAIAVLYSPDKKAAYALYSSRKGKPGSETLNWLNIPEGEMMDAKTLLFAKITGSFDNHPDQFNAQEQ